VFTPSHYSKPWWTPHLTTLRREFRKVSRMARKHGTPALWDVATISKVGCFKAIKTAKNKHWSSFLLGATPQTLWRAKRFAYCLAPPRFPSLTGAVTPEQMNDVLLDHFFPPKELFSHPPDYGPTQSPHHYQRRRSRQLSPSAPPHQPRARTGFPTPPGSKSTG